MDQFYLGLSFLKNWYTYNYLLSRNNRGVGSQREVDSWVGHQVGLELREIHIQGTIKSENKNMYIRYVFQSHNQNHDKLNYLTLIY